MRNRIPQPVPIDVNENVFDAQHDDDLLPMDVDEPGGNDNGKEERQPITRRLDRAVGKVTQMGAVTAQELVVEEIMKTSLTIPLGTLAEIAPGVKRGLVSAVRDMSSSPARGSPRQSGSTKLNVAQGGGERGPSGLISNLKVVNLAVARDDLLKMRVYLGDTAATAIIDTGSQLNLIREDVFTASGLVRTEESTVSVTGATGDGDTCIGMIPEAEVYISSGKIMTLGPEIHVVETAPFQVLLGRPWLTLNGVSIEERVEGTCVALEVDGKRYVINVSPNPEFIRRNGGRSRVPLRSTRPRRTYLTLGARAPGTSGNIEGTLKELDQFASDVSTRHSLITFGM